MSEQILHIEKLLSREDISTSERRFAQSLRDSFTKYGRLSNRQWSAFQRMEARYNEEVIAQRKIWSDNWSEKKAKHSKIAAQYYLKNPPYFRDLAIKILEEDNLILSEKQYNKMIENKYVQKVITITESDPLFPVGCLVQIRKTARGQSYPLRDRIAMVVTNDGPVFASAKGARTYSILPFGESNTVDIQERYLKKKRK
jgi:hypothetical protein